MDYKISNKNLEIYRNYQYERAKTYYRKENGLVPYSEDKYLSRYKFTNVKRYLDRQSRFLIDTVCNNQELKLIDKLMNCFMFRGFNHENGAKYLKEWPIKFSELTKDKIAEFEVFEKSQESGHQLQSNAYFLSHIRKQANRYCDYSLPTQTALVNWVWGLFPQFEEIEKSLNDPDEVLRLLNQIPSIGAFMGYQIWVDFSYIDEVPFDDNYLVVSGPGCDDGILWFMLDTSSDFELVTESGHKYLKYGEAWKYVREQYPDFNTTEFITWLEVNIQRLMDEAGLEWNPKEFLWFLPEHQQVWNKMDIENSFCEFNKLRKLMEGHRFRYRWYSKS